MQSDRNPARRKVVLQPQDDAGTAAPRLLLGLLDAMEAAADGVRHGLGEESLHEFRVAVRRTRALLAHAKTLLPRSTASEFRERFAALGAATGPARDLDVQLLAFPRLTNLVTPEYRSALQSVRLVLLARREAEHRALQRQLASSRYRRLMRDWRALLESGDELWTASAEARSPALHWAHAALRRRYHRVMTRGAALGPEVSDEAFHELRKDCKKLRYLTEFFASLFPGREPGVLIKALKRLQDRLGEFQDLSVQLRVMSAYRDELRDDPDCDSRTMTALRMVTVGLEERKRTLRAGIIEAFEGFARHKNQRRFEALFTGQPPVAKGGAHAVRREEQRV